MSYTSLKIYLKKKFPRAWEIIKLSGLSKMVQGTITMLIPVNEEITEIKNLLDRDQYGVATTKLKHYMIRGQYNSGADFKSKMSSVSNACGTAFVITKIDNNDVEFDSGKMSLDTNYVVASSCGYENRSAVWIIKSGKPNESTPKIERPTLSANSNSSADMDKKNSTSKKKGAAEYKTIADWRTWLMRLHYTNRDGYASQLMHTFQYMLRKLESDHLDLYKVFVNIMSGILEVDCITLLYTPELFSMDLITSLLQSQQSDSNIQYKSYDEFVNFYVDLYKNKQQVCENNLASDPNKIHHQVTNYISTHCSESAGMGTITKYDELFKHIADNNTIPECTDKIYDDTVFSYLSGKSELIKVHSEIIYIITSLLVNNHGSKPFVLGIFLETFGSISNHITKSTAQMQDIFFNPNERCNYVRTMVKHLYKPISTEQLTTLNKLHC